MDFVGGGGNIAITNALTPSFCVLYCKHQIVYRISISFFYAFLRLRFLDVETNPGPRRPVPTVSRLLCSNVLVLDRNLRDPSTARGRVGRVTDCGVRGLWFKSPGSILTSRTETSSLSRVVRDGWDPSSVPVSG